MTKQEISLLPSQVIAGIEYKHESYEEWVFAAWCRVLWEIGAIESARRPMSISVSEPLSFCYHTKLKTKVKTDEYNIVGGGYYKGDMIIHWNPDWEGVFHINEGFFCRHNPSPRGKWCKTHHLFYCKDKNMSMIDVKGTFKKSGHTPLSRSQQLMAEANWFLQKVVPLGKKGLFMQTFVTDEELYTPKKKQRRAHYKTLHEYLIHCDTIGYDIPKGLAEWRENQIIY